MVIYDVTKVELEREKKKVKKDVEERKKRMWDRWKNRREGRSYNIYFSEIKKMKIVSSSVLDNDSCGSLRVGRGLWY